ncbi:MAG: NAD-dependent epimerase/dehydratase family protein [Chloroflexi bacterium]|nr:NAD-dependent epimerase/dehydratase family protein [Chloroflexota bacterium]
MATTLVTGATGFVGSWVARSLVDAGHQVRIMRRESSRLDAINDLDVEHITGDLTDPAILARAVDGIEWVFHVAAVSAYWRTEKERLYEVNVDGTRLLLEASERAGVSRFIFTSSAAATGLSTDGYTISEAHHFNTDPRLYPYGHSKFLAEAEVYKALQRGLDCVILNPAVILGPGDLNLISGSLIIEMAEGRVPFMPMQGGITIIDVRDVARYHLLAAEKGRTGERYLLGTADLSNQALFKLIARIVGTTPPRIPTYRPVVHLVARLADLAHFLRIKLPGDVEGNQLRLSTHEIYFDCNKAWRELGDPQHDIPQSIADTYRWYQASGYL